MIRPTALHHVRLHARRFSCAVAVGLAIQLPIASAHAQDTAAAHAPERRITISHAVRTTAAIRIDGHLNEPAWAAAPVTDHFTQIDPDEGKPASEPTEVRVLYDDEALYVGVRASDTGQVIGRLGRRDMPLGDSDWIGVMIDSYHDHRTAFGFDVNPVGVKRDEATTIETDDNSWDAVWDVATSIDSAGWTAEYRIPFSQLRFSSAADQTWGVQFERIIGRRREYAVSTFIPKSDVGGVPGYGHLVGLSNLSAGKRLEVLPYTVARAEYVDPGVDPYRGKQEYDHSVGLDVKYRVASNLTLNATVNPDFGQVEVDPAVVNLGVYETFFQEKRPFFLEGSEIFNFGGTNTSGGRLFYTRRIGRAPTLSPPSPYSDIPTSTTILGAAKLSGKVGGWSIGTLGAVTGREESKYLDTAGIDRRFVSEPQSEYFVGRARRELRSGRTIIGGILTAAHRSLDNDVLRASFRSSALAAGTDFLFQSWDRTWALSGDAEASRIGGTPASIVAVERANNHFFQRPDAHHLHVDSAATSLFGYSVSSTLSKQAGRHWRGNLAGALTSPGYEVNDLGFAVRTDRQDAQLDVTYYEFRPGRIIRNWSGSGVVRSEHNYAHEPIQTFAGGTYSALFMNYWHLAVQEQRGFRAFDDRLTRGGPIAIRPATWTSSVSLASDGRQPVIGTGNFFGQTSEAGAWTAITSAGVALNVSTRWNLSVGPVLTREYLPAQPLGSVADASYTPTYGHRYIFAPLTQTELGIQTRFNVTFTPNLSLETYAQPLISAADFGSPTQLVAPRTYDFAPYGGSVPSYDFNLRSLRGNAVLRWEWRPGSTLYAVWQQSRQDIGQVGDFSFSRDRNALVGTRPDNIFLLKINYWLNP